MHNELPHDVVAFGDAARERLESVHWRNALEFPDRVLARTR